MNKPDQQKRGGEFEFFIAGSQRSGTTLLRLALECHPDVYCFDELDSYRTLASRCLEVAVSKAHVGFKVPRWTEQLDAPILRDFGLSDEARQIYNGQRILFMVRDYRDTIASMLKLAPRIPWLEEWAVPIIRCHVQSTSGFVEMWDHELKLCKAAPNHHIGLGALYWKYKTAAFLRYKELRYPILAICYERLAAQPEKEFRRISDFLGISFDEAVLSHPSHVHREIQVNGLAVGNTDPRRSIDTTCVCQWPMFLDSRDSELAREIVGSLPAQMARYFD